MGNVWTAVLPAVTALAGVLLGQVLQGRREEKRWHRGRERDQELSSHQRAQNVALWAREDRNRFVDYRRDLYADYLASLVKHIDVIDQASIRLDIEDHRRADEQEELLDDYQSWLIENGYTDPYAASDLRQRAQDHCLRWVSSVGAGR